VSNNISNSSLLELIAASKSDTASCRVLIYSCRASSLAKDNPSAIFSISLSKLFYAISRAYL
jgi:hypothetical protein